MKEDNFLEFLLKNKIVILCVVVALLLAALGILEILAKVILTVFAVLLAIYIGKRIQQDKNYIKKMFGLYKDDDDKM